MSHSELASPPDSSDLVTLRDLVQPLVRNWRVALTTFGLLFWLALLAALVMRPHYEATMKLLVKRERMDPVISSSATEQVPGRVEVTEDELNSEVELLQGRDLLQRVAQDAGLVDTGTSATRVELSRAVEDLRGRLAVSPIRRSTLIDVRYRSADPEEAARVLESLARLYVEKHLALHRPLGAYTFFQDQTKAFGERLVEAEQRLAEFGRTEQVVSPAAERDTTLQTLAEFEATLRRTETLVSEVDERVAALKRQIAGTPTRQTTQIHTAKDGDRIRELKSKLFDFERKHADMSRYYSPEYPPLRQVGEQIAQARAALADAESTPLTSEVTDQNPTHQWLRDEVTKAATERDGLVARALALATAIAEYRAKAQRLEGARVRQDELVRAMKTAQQNFELYQRKQEEARISDALDHTRVANVVLAEAPVVPALPIHSRRLAVAVLGFLAAMAAGLLAAYVAHYRNPYFRADDEVEALLGLPVLAKLPSERRLAS